MNRKLKLLSLFISVFIIFCGCQTSTEQPVIPDSVKENTEKVLTFMGSGDNIIYSGNIKEAKLNAKDGGREYNFKPTFENVAEKIANADIAFINQETVMCGEGYDISYYPTFNSPRDMGYDLVEMGYDVINTASNHMLDKGTKGYERTIEFWKDQKCLMIGGYENEEDYSTTRILEKDGIKIAFLSYVYGTNGITKASSSEIVIPYINDEDIVKHIENAKKQADLIFVSMHWGDEGAFKPNSEQQRLAQLIADKGADVIIGHHPHVIQPVQWLTGAGGNKTLCIYSLGNFAAEQAYDYNMIGGIIEFNIVWRDGEKPRIENPVFTPTVYHFQGNFLENRIYPLQDYTSELAKNHAVSNYYGHKFNYERLFKYVTDTIDKEFLPTEFVEKYCMTE